MPSQARRAECFSPGGPKGDSPVREDRVPEIIDAGGPEDRHIPAGTIVWAMQSISSAVVLVHRTSFAALETLPGPDGPGYHLPVLRTSNHLPSYPVHPLSRKT